MYLYVTDYLVNSGLYASFKAGQMTFNVTEEIRDMVCSHGNVEEEMGVKGTTISARAKHYESLVYFVQMYSNRGTPVNTRKKSIGASSSLWVSPKVGKSPHQPPKNVFFHLQIRNPESV